MPEAPLPVAACAVYGSKIAAVIAGAAATSEASSAAAKAVPTGETVLTDEVACFLLMPTAM